LEVSVKPSLPQTSLSAAPDLDSAAPARLDRERFADPTAKAMWAALMTLEEGVQHQFLRELRGRLAMPEVREGAQATRIARSVSALWEAAELLAVEREESAAADEAVADEKASVSEREFARLRGEHPEFGWPAESCVRKWLGGGSWNDALRRARLDAVEDGDGFAVVKGSAFDWDEVAEAVRTCRDALCGPNYDRAKDFGLHAYLAWAGRPDILHLPGRRPRSQGPFDRFGGFAAVKAAALANAGPPRAVRGETSMPQSGYGYTDDQLATFINEVARRLGRTPRAAEYMPARADILDREAKKRQGPARPFVVYETIIKAFGSWDAALVAAGLEPFAPVRLDVGTGRGERLGPRNHIPTEDVLAGLAEAFAEKGKPFGVNPYKDYVTERGGTSKAGRRLATYGCIYQRWRSAEGGPWKTVCDLALPKGWDQS